MAGMTALENLPSCLLLCFSPHAPDLFVYAQRCCVQRRLCCGYHWQRWCQRNGVWREVRGKEKHNNSSEMWKGPITGTPLFDLRPGRLFYRSGSLSSRMSEPLSYLSLCKISSILKISVTSTILTGRRGAPRNSFVKKHPFVAEGVYLWPLFLYGKNLRPYE